MAAGASEGNMAPVTEILDTTGFLVADSLGHRVGRVECPMYGTAPSRPDSLAVCSRRHFGRHFVVPESAIGTINRRARLVQLRRERGELQRFL
jgi:hypothetical protein